MTFPDPYSLMLRQERRLETTVLLRCRRCLVRACMCSAVRGVGSGVAFAPGRCFTVCGSQRQRFRADGWLAGWRVRRVLLDRSCVKRVWSGRNLPDG